jgi:hypothetical protein
MWIQWVLFSFAFSNNLLTLCGISLDLILFICNYKTKHMLRRILHFLVILMLPAMSLAQTTTSSIAGVVKTAAGEPLVGATIVATHEPTGTVYRTQSRTGGRFNINNMNPGGPYTVEISFVNYATEKKSDIYLNLGDTYQLDLGLNTKANELTGVQVTTKKTPTEFSGKGGTEVSIGRDKMENLPTVGRNINDYLRAIPQAKLTQANNEGVTIAGQNNRYNSFYVDGALNNDVFGLAASGTNGGQTSTPPLSIDAIDQFQVVISPYDASLGNFTGGGINAITRSGTNKTQGSVYFFYRNQDLAGKTPTGGKSDATKLADFKNKTYGFRVGGALMKNKLFYFINAESQRDLRPQPFDVYNRYQGFTKTQADIQRLIDTLRVRGYDPGTYLDNPEIVNSDRIAAKVDWNISDKHKLSVSHRFTKADRFNTNVSSTTAVNFGNNGWIQPNRTNSTSIELKSVLGTRFSNRLLLTFTSVDDDRNPIGQDYPRVKIDDGTGTGTTQGLVIGPDPSSNVNILTQKNWSIFDALKVSLGKHSFTVGGEFEYSDVKNAFIQRTFGEYMYDSIGQFYRNLRPKQFRVAFSNIDNDKTDNTNAAAAFKIAKAAAFFNDEFRVSTNLSLNFGIRADIYKWLSTPVTDPFANTVAIPKFAALYNLEGARSGMTPKIPVSISPRFGVTYRIPEENIIIRGGLGYFTGRIPLVWPGGVYNNNGLFIGGFIANSGTNTTAWNNVRFRSNPYGQWSAQELGIGLANAKGGLNLISESFKNPRVFRTNVAIDKKFQNNWNVTLEGIFTKNINEVYYTNLSAQAPLGYTAGAETRLVYPTAPLPINGTINPYDNAILLTNNHGPKGFAYNFSLAVDKRTRTGFTFSASYNFGNSVVVNEATSSVNLSQWQFMETVNGRNNITRSISDFSVGHRVFAFASKKFTYLQGKLATTVSLVYNGQSGNAFSYVYSGAITKDDASVGGTGGNDLIYVPTTQELQTYSLQTNTIGGVTYTRQQQIDALDMYISNDRYLSNHRGKFAERNGSRLPFTHLLDLKVAQDVNIKVGSNRYQFQITFDMFNFTNFLNRDWGRTYFLSNDQYALLTFRGFTTAGNTAPTTAQTAATYSTSNNTPVYQFNPINNTRTPWGISTSAVPANSARWIGQIGLRFNFN